MNLTIGASVVLASRAAIVEERLLRTAALWSLLGFQAVLILPIGAYLLWRFPDWSYMYLAEPGAAGGRDWPLALAYPVAALVGFFFTRALIRQGRTAVAFAFGGGCLALAAAIVAFGHRQLFGVGTTEAFRANAEALQPIASSTLVWVLIPATLAVIAGWGVMLWRLFLYGQAWRPTDLEAMASVHLVDADQPQPAGTLQLPADDGEDG